VLPVTLLPVGSAGELVLGEGLESEPQRECHRHLDVAPGLTTLQTFLFIPNRHPVSWYRYTPGTERHQEFAGHARVEQYDDILGA
jgi:hypothetical protein